MRYLFYLSLFIFYTIPSMGSCQELPQNSEKTETSESAEAGLDQASSAYFENAGRSPASEGQRLKPAEAAQKFLKFFPFRKYEDEFRSFEESLLLFGLSLDLVSSLNAAPFAQADFDQKTYYYPTWQFNPQIALNFELRLLRFIDLSLGAFYSHFQSRSALARTFSSTNQYQYFYAEGFGGLTALRLVSPWWSIKPFIGAGAKLSSQKYTVMNDFDTKISQNRFNNLFSWYGEAGIEWQSSQSLGFRISTRWEELSFNQQPFGGAVPVSIAEPFNSNQNPSFRLRSALKTLNLLGSVFFHF